MYESDVLIFGVFGIVARPFSLTVGSSKERLLEMIGIWLGFLASVLTIVLLRSTKALGLFIDFKIDRDMLTPSDLAIKLDNLPIGEVSESLIVDFLQQKYKAALQQEA